MIVHFITRIHVYGKYKAENYHKRHGKWPWDRELC